MRLRKSGLELREISNHRRPACQLNNGSQDTTRQEPQQLGWSIVEEAGGEGMMDRSGWIAKRAVRGVGAWTDFPTWACSLTHKPADRHWRFLYAAGMPGYTCAFHPYPSTCSVFTLSQQEEDRTTIPSVQGKQQAWIRKRNFCLLRRLLDPSPSCRGSSGHSASQTFLASKRTLVLAGRLEEGGLKREQTW